MEKIDVVEFYKWLKNNFLDTDEYKSMQYDQKIVWLGSWLKFYDQDFWKREDSEFEKDFEQMKYLENNQMYTEELDILRKNIERYRENFVKWREIYHTYAHEKLALKGLAINIDDVDSYDVFFYWLENNFLYTTDYKNLDFSEKITWLKDWLNFYNITTYNKFGHKAYKKIKTSREREKFYNEKHAWNSMVSCKGYYKQEEENLELSRRSHKISKIEATFEPKKIVVKSLTQLLSPKIKEKYTQKEKKEITKEWVSYFPQMGIIDTYFIGRFIGPVFISIWLETKNWFGAGYSPHIQANNWIEIDGITSGPFGKHLTTPIHYQMELQEKIEKINRLKELFIIKTDEEFTLENIYQAYLTRDIIFYKENITSYKVPIDIILIASWAGELEKAEEYFQSRYDFDTDSASANTIWNMIKDPELVRQMARDKLEEYRKLKPKYKFENANIQPIKGARYQGTILD